MKSNEAEPNNRDPTSSQLNGEEPQFRTLPDYSKEQLPKASLSQVTGPKRKDKKPCRHVGTKKIRFGYKATARGFVQRYFCYGCNGTFTTKQQMINEFL